jgi:hypothetical protein
MSRKTGTAKSLLYESMWIKESVCREPPFREDLRAESEEFPLLEAITREWLVKT